MIRPGLDLGRHPASGEPRSPTARRPGARVDAGRSMAAARAVRHLSAAHDAVGRVRRRRPADPRSAHRHRRQAEPPRRLREQPPARHPWSASSARRSASCSPSRSRAETCLRAGSALIDAATLLPLISPPFTTSISFIFSFGPRGLITYDLLGLKGTNVYGLASTLAAEVLTYFPIAYLTLRPVLSGIGGNLEEMAFSLGSRRLHVFRTVTLPSRRARTRQRVPAAVCGFARRFRHAAHPRRQRLPGAADRGLSADHRPVRPQGRRRPVRAAAGARRDRLSPAAQLGGARPLCDRDRQGRAAVCHPQRDAGGALPARRRVAAPSRSSSSISMRCSSSLRLWRPSAPTTRGPCATTR